MGQGRAPTDTTRQCEQRTRSTNPESFPRVFRFPLAGRSSRRPWLCPSAGSRDLQRASRCAASAGAAGHRSEGQQLCAAGCVRAQCPACKITLARPACVTHFPHAVLPTSVRTHSLSLRLWLSACRSVLVWGVGSRDCYIQPRNAEVLVRNVVAEFNMMPSPAQTCLWRGFPALCARKKSPTARPPLLLMLMLTRVLRLAIPVALHFARAGRRHSLDRWRPRRSRTRSRPRLTAAWGCFRLRLGASATLGGSG